MSVEKMKLLSITGKEENIDEFIAVHLLDSGMQTEDAVKVFEKGWKLTNFKYDSTPKDLLKQCQNLLDRYKIKYNKKLESESISKSLEELQNDFLEVKNNINGLEEEIKEKNKELDELKQKNEILRYSKNFDINLNDLYKLEYVKFRYGKIAKENFGRLENSLRELSAVVLKTSESEDNNYWIICLATKENSAKVDSYLNVFKFERFELPEDLEGNPKELWEVSENKIQELTFELENKKNELNRIIDRDAMDLVEFYSDFNLYIKINNVKKFMAYDENGLFYIIGWVPARELTKVLANLSKEKDIKYVVKNHDEVASIPPTKLKNNGIVRPFETLVKMYGLPNYTEIDPTAFVAITAFLLFGFMFGDVGQGLIIFIIGLIMAKKKIEMGTVFEAGRNSFNDIWGSIWKYIWKRGCNSSHIYESYEKYTSNVNIWNCYRSNFNYNCNDI